MATDDDLPIVGRAGVPGPQSITSHEGQRHPLAPPLGSIVIDDLPPDAELSSVAAPVFGPDGTMLFAIALMPERHGARDIPALSRAVLRAAGRVMAAIDGRQPGAAGAEPAAARRQVS